MMMVSMLIKSTVRENNCFELDVSVLSGVLDCAEGSGRDILRAKTEKKLEETVSSEVKISSLLLSQIF